MPTSSFFDSFFFAILVLVASLAFIDFLLGKKGRERIKERVGDWWLFLDDTTYAGLGAADAAKIHGWFRARLGPVASFRFWVSAWAGMCVLLVIALFALSSLLDGSFISGAPERLLAVFEVLADRSLVLVLANVMLPVVSLVVTLGLLRLMSSSNSLLLLLLLTLGGAVAVLTVIVVTVTIVQSHKTWDVFDFGNVFDQLIWMSGGFVALLPLLLHILLASLFMASKLTVPILKPPINLILLRLHESEKGVLSLIGVALGTLAKLAQEGLKLL